MVLSGKPVAEKLLSDARRSLSLSGEEVRMMVILIGDDPSSIKYVQSKRKRADELGVKFELLQFSENSNESEVLEKINDKIKQYLPHGVLIERPLPEHFDWEKIQELIPADADIDCERFDNLGRLLSGCPRFIPATVKAVFELLQFYKIDCAGKNIVILGRSNVVGMPLAVMLAQKKSWGNATVTICHTKTADIAFHTRSADIVIACAGKPNLLKSDMIKEGAVVIDVGVNVVDDKIVGDVDFEGVSKKASAITPVPGGIGLITTACLFVNLAHAVNNFSSKNKNVAKGKL